MQLEKEEIRLAVSALLAWFSTDINIDINSDDEDAMFELAKKLQVINGEPVDVSNMFVVGSSFHDEPYKVKTLQKHFDVKEK